MLLFKGPSLGIDDMISNPIVILKGCHDMPWLFKLTTLLHCLCAPATHCCCHVFDTHGGSAKRFILLWQLTKKWLSSYPVYWRNANSQNYFWPNGLWQIGNIWSTTERNKNTTIGCVVPAWSARGNPKLCRGKPKLCRGKSKLCRGPTNPKLVKIMYAQKMLVWICEKHLKTWCLGLSPFVEPFLGWPCDVHSGWTNYLFLCWSHPHRTACLLGLEVLQEITLEVTITTWIKL